MRNLKKMMALTMVSALTLQLFACGSNATTTNTTSSATATTAAETKELTEDDLWKQEPAYGKKVKYYISDGCTAGTVIADLKGFYQAEGLEVEGVKGKSDVEMLGTGNVDIAVGHVAKQLVPATNGADIIFVGGAHILEGCKGLYVAADSKYEYIEDLANGAKISCPNGIGNSDYNITARLLDLCGINPLNDVDLVVVENSACVPAMQKGELDAALLGDAFAYDMVKDGTLRELLSKADSHKDKLCCAITMSGKFVRENPITAKKAARAVKNALAWMGANPEEATDFLLKEGLNSGDKEKNVELNTRMKFGMTDADTEAEMRNITKDYIKLNLLTAYTDADEVMSKFWNPLN